jgi:hypothetical protein
MKRDDICCLSCHKPICYRYKRKTGSEVFTCITCNYKISIFDTYFVRERGKGLSPEKSTQSLLYVSPSKAFVCQKSLLKMLQKTTLGSFKKVRGQK